MVVDLPWNAPTPCLLARLLLPACARLQRLLCLLAKALLYVVYLALACLCIAVLLGAVTYLAYLGMVWRSAIMHGTADTNMSPDHSNLIQVRLPSPVRLRHCAARVLLNCLCMRVRRCTCQPEAPALMQLAALCCRYRQACNCFEDCTVDKSFHIGSNTCGAYRLSRPVLIKRASRLTRRTGAAIQSCYRQC